MIGRSWILPFVVIAACSASTGSPSDAYAQTTSPTKGGNEVKKSGPPASQDPTREEPRPVRPVIDLRPRPPVAPTPAPVIDDNRPHVTADDDLARLFQEAELLSEQREFELAAVRYRQLLDASRTALTELPPLGTAARRWSTWGARAEQSLLRSPDTLKSAYRLVAEGEAQATLASLADDDRAARDARLSDASQRFLLTTAGLNATWTLSGRELDQFDFVSAARLLERFLAAAPPHDSRRSAALLRLAVATAFLGDHGAARGALDAERSLVGALPPMRSSSEFSANAAPEIAEPERTTIRAFVERLLESPGMPFVERQLPNAPHWLMGSSSSVAARAMVTHAWDADFDRRQLAQLAGRPTSNDTESARRIAATLRLLDPRSFDNSYDDVLPRLDAASVSRRWSRHPVFSPAPFVHHQGSWIGTWIDRTAVHTSPPKPDSPKPDSPTPDSPKPGALTPALEYPFPAAWKALPVARVSMRSESARWEAGDLPVFLDPVHGALTANERSVFVVQSDRSDATHTVIRNAARATSLRARANLLVAYDLSTGEEQWRTEETRDESTTPLVDEGIIGAPVAHESRVFLPCVERGVVVVRSLNAETGEPAWSTKLCAEPRTGCWPWSGVTMTLDADDLYVATGAGAIFALSASTGEFRWGSEYPRTAERRRDLTRSTGGPGTAAGSTASAQAFESQLDGWDEDRAQVAGRWLVVTASDAAVLRVLDRRDGRTLWTTPRRLPDGRAAAYVAGVDSRYVIVGGATFLRAYELVSGKLAWTTDLPGKSGRAILTRDAILVPRIFDTRPLPSTDVSADVPTRQARAILTLVNPARGARLHDVSVPITHAHAPVTLAVSAERIGWREPHRLIEVGAHAEGAAAAGAAAATDAASRTASNTASPNVTADDSWRPTPVSGRVLVSDLSAGKIIELTLDGHVVWQRDGFSLPGPICGHSNGRRFVYSHGEEALLEFDEAGQVRSRFVDLPGRPASMTSMPDGRLLLAFPDAGRLGVFDPRTRTLETRRCGGRPVDARRYADGTTLLTLLADQRVIRLESEAWPFDIEPKSVDGSSVGIVTSTMQGGLELSYPRSARRRGDGSILVCLPREGQIIQSPALANTAPGPVGNSPRASLANSRVIRAGLRGLQAAIELPDGRLLVADQSGLTVWEAERVIWKHAEVLVGGVSAW